MLKGWERQLSAIDIVMRFRMNPVAPLALLERCYVYEGLHDSCLESSVTYRGAPSSDGRVCQIHLAQYVS